MSAFGEIWVKHHEVPEFCFLGDLAGVEVVELDSRTPKGHRRVEVRVIGAGGAECIHRGFKMPCKFSGGMAVFGARDCPTMRAIEAEERREKAAAFARDWVRDGHPECAKCTGWDSFEDLAAGRTRKGNAKYIRLYKQGQKTLCRHLAVHCEFHNPVQITQSRDSLRESLERCAMAHRETGDDWIEETTRVWIIQRAPLK